MINIGGRIVKTGIAAGLSVFIARLFSLEPAVFAALISTLSVQRSFANSLRRSFNIVMSVVAGSLIGAVFAFTFGSNPLAITIATIIMITVCLKLNWQDQIVLSVVTVLTLMEFDSQNFLNFTVQRLLVGLIGAFCGILLNIPFMPYHKKNLEEKLQTIDEKSRNILETFIERINPEKRKDINFSCDNVAENIKSLRDEINEGIELAKLLQEEQRYRFVPDTPPEKYLQNLHTFSVIADLLQDMNNVVDFVKTDVPHLVPVIRVSNLIGQAQKRVMTGRKIPANTIEKIITNVEKKSWWAAPPDCESDFHTRSALFYFYIELKKYFRNVSRLHPMPQKTKEKLFLTNIISRFSPLKRRKQSRT